MTTEVTVKVRRIAPAQPFRGIDADLFTQVGTECCLGAKTFIYGRNGTGKTTFAELLRLAGTGELTVTADYWENDRWKQGPIPTSVVRQIHVFNRYYVDDHLAFFLDGSGSSAGILKLGQVNVDAEKARRDLESDIQRQGKRLEDVIAARERLTRRIENSRKSAKQRAIDVLGPALPMKYSTQSFTVADARKAIEERCPCRRIR